MRFDIEDAILGMYDSIERAREYRLQQGIPIRSTAGNHVWKAPGSDCSYHS